MKLMKEHHKTTSTIVPQEPFDHQAIWYCHCQEQAQENSEDSIYPSFLGHSTGIMFIIVEIEYSNQGYFALQSKKNSKKEEAAGR